MSSERESHILKVGYFSLKPGCWLVLSPIRKETSSSDQTLTFASHSKNNSEGYPSNQVSAAAMTSASDEKWRTFNCFFSRVGLRTYQHPLYYFSQPHIPVINPTTTRAINWRARTTDEQQSVSRRLCIYGLIPWSSYTIPDCTCMKLLMMGGCNTRNM